MTNAQAALIAAATLYATVDVETEVVMRVALDLEEYLGKRDKWNKRNEQYEKDKARWRDKNR